MTCDPASFLHLDRQDEDDVCSTWSFSVPCSVMRRCRSYDSLLSPWTVTKGLAITIAECCLPPTVKSTPLSLGLIVRRSWGKSAQNVPWLVAFQLRNQRYNAG